MGLSDALCRLQVIEIGKHRHFIAVKLDTQTPLIQYYACYAHENVSWAISPFFDIIQRISNSFRLITNQMDRFILFFCGLNVMIRPQHFHRVYRRISDILKWRRQLRCSSNVIYFPLDSRVREPQLWKILIG